jgi:autotransporter translocation and assembly factor TamB
MNRETQPLIRRRLLLLGVLIALLGSAWLVHGPVLSQLVRWAVPWAAQRAGYTVTLGGVRADLMAPIRLTGIEVSRPGGTRLQAAVAELDWARARDWGWAPATWIRRLTVSGLSGTIAPDEARPEPEAPPALPGAPTAGAPWPQVVEVRDGNLLFTGPGWSLDLRGLDLSLMADRTGSLRLREAAGQAGRMVKKFSGLRAVTAWRGGVAYFADLALGENVVIDSLSAALSGPAALTLEARAGGGYVYADLSGRGAATKAALNALNVSLAGAAEFAGLEGDMAGTVDLAKLTFNGDPAHPFAAQISLRLEAKDFAWRKNAVEELTAGLSLAGRRLRLSECLLRQKANEVKLRGTLTVPPRSADWRGAPFDFEIDADVGNLRALAGLFGAPWNELSGGLRVEGRGTGRAADGEGWLKVRGWDLRARGIPASSQQADLKLEGRDLKLTGLDAQSGPDFARGGGQLSLGESLNYQGRLELRVRELSRYLEPLGRFAPDWAREGGVLLFWDGDGAASAHSGVATLELVRFTGDLNPVPVNGKLSASYSPGNIYVSRFLLDRGPLSLSSSAYFGAEGLAVQDIQMFSGRSRLLRGELFLPLSLDAVLSRQPWGQTLVKGGEVSARVRSDNLDLASLVELFGQETTLRGKADLSLEASGPWENAAIDGRLSVTGLRASFPAWQIPDARASVEWKVKDRRAAVGARLQPSGAEEITVQAELPLIGAKADGGWTLLDPTAPWSALLDIPSADLARFTPGFAGATIDRGTLRGKVRVDGTLSAPQPDGSLEWSNGRITFPGPWLPVEDAQATIAFRSGEAVLEETRGRMGKGTFGLAGQVVFAGGTAPRWEVLLRGGDLSLYADANVRLNVSPDLEARGSEDSGEIKGTLGLDGSAVLRGLTVTPRLIAAAAPPEPPARAESAGSLAAWNLDLKVSSSAALPVGAPAGDGSLVPDLYLQGTAGRPLLLGTIRADKLPLRWPSGAALVASGRAHFTREKPWSPWLDLAGTGLAGAYDIRSAVFGFPDQGQLSLSSAPALTTEQIVLLLTTGVSPVPREQAAPATPEGKLTAEPSWLELGSIRGLFGWNTGEAAAGEEGEAAFSDRGTVGFEWSWP